MFSLRGNLGSFCRSPETVEPNSDIIYFLWCVGEFWHTFISCTAHWATAWKCHIFLSLVRICLHKLPIWHKQSFLSRTGFLLSHQPFSASTVSIADLLKRSVTCLGHFSIAFLMAEKRCYSGVFITLLSDPRNSSIYSASSALTKHTLYDLCLQRTGVKTLLWALLYRTNLLFSLPYITADISLLVSCLIIVFSLAGPTLCFDYLLRRSAYSEYICESCVCFPER